MKKIFQFYIFSNIHVALATFCLVKITLLPYNTIENTTSFFVFLATIASYNLIRLLRISDITDWFSTWLQSNKKALYVIIGISVVCLILITLKLEIKAIICLLPFGIFTLFYMIPLPFKRKTLRKISGVKLFLIAVSWAGITVFFPLVQNKIKIGFNEWIIFIQRFLFIALIIIPFDIRDMKYDSAKLKTLPQVFGVEKAKKIGLLFGLLFLFLELAKQQVVKTNFNIELIIVLIALIFLMRSKDNQSKYYAAFWVELLPILWYILLISNFL